MDQTAQQKHRQVLFDHRNVIAHLEYAISQQRILSRDLNDKDVVRAVDSLLETYKTEDTGLLYERIEENLRIESVRRELREIIESYRNPGGEEAKGIVDPKNTRLQLGAAMDCLKFIRSLATVYLKDRDSASGYVDFLARIVPREEARKSIIVPGNTP